MLRKVIIASLILICLIIVAVLVCRHERAKHRLTGYIEATPENTIPPEDITQTAEYQKMALHYHNAERLYFHDGEITEAMGELKSGLIIADSIYRKALSIFLDRIALCFMDLGIEDSALFYSDQAIKANNNYYGERLGEIYYTRAVILRRFYHMQGAIEYLEKTYYEFSARQRNAYLAAVAAELAVLHEAMGEFEKARHYRYVIYGCQLYEEKE